MSHNILDVFSLTDYDNASELNASSYFFLPDPFQRALPTARTNPPQNNQFLDSIALTRFATLPDNFHQQLTISTIPVWKPFSAPPEKTFTIIRRPLQSIPLSSLRILWPTSISRKGYLGCTGRSVNVCFVPSISIDIAHPGTASKLPQLQSTINETAVSASCPNSPRN